MTINWSQVSISTVNFRGGMHDRFHARRDSGQGPGWFIYGHNPAYGDNYVMRCAWPARKPRRHVHYNGPVLHGWRTKREAQAIANALNARASDCQALMYSVPLCGTVFKES